MSHMIPLQLFPVVHIHVYKSVLAPDLCSCNGRILIVRRTERFHLGLCPSGEQPGPDGSRVEAWV